MRPAWIKSPAFDLGLIIGPALVSVALVCAIPALRATDVPPWAWLVFVVGVDVAHVWSSLYRTYLDPDEMARRRTYYIVTPLLCFMTGAVLYWVGGYLLFWRVLAYLAVLHFVRQQFGFVMVYRHRAGERDHAWIDKLAIYATMLYPLVWWHATPGRAFDWFVTGDFLKAPASLKTVGVVLYTAILALWAARQIQLAAQKRVNWPKIGIVVSTALTWYVGIVAFNSDFAFTVTNVVAHGVPYMALVWLYGRRKWEGTRTWRERLHHPAFAFAFVGVILVLGYFEEGLWDLFIWKEHGAIFGNLAPPRVSDEALAVIVPMLVLPQATHYVLDSWIWRFDGSNPGLRYYLFLDGPKPTSA